jgi:predicted aldo/keto reductase-like oxidoreductase
MFSCHASVPFKARCTVKDSDRSISRRSFIEKSAACIIGAGIGLAGSTNNPAAQEGDKNAPKQPAQPKEQPKIKAYRKLGKTSWDVSDISFGSAGMQDPSLLEHAMERGINYVDTARQYYDMEKVIGQIFPAKRDKLFVTTKLMPELITAEVTADNILKAIDESLERLNTDYVDCCMIHSIGDPNLGDSSRVKNENIYEAFTKAKKSGKIRFYGASSHGPKMLEDFNWLIDNAGIDVIMPGMNYLTKGLKPLLAKAHKKGVAVVAMKTLSAARKIDFSTYMKEGRTVRQALLKWMLAQPNIDTLAITMRTFEEIDEFVSVSGDTKLGQREKDALEGYSLLLENSYCRPGCDGCLDACPHKIPIADVMRYRLYFHHYGREKYAMGLYASLPKARNASHCTSCSGSCTVSCPYNIPIREKLIAAHAELTT